jgi:phosphatidylserine/phosphatidylglycerophosphate/cardiolipin synthase-like enzyme
MREAWVRRMNENDKQSTTDFPAYWRTQPTSLICSAKINNFSLGTGHSLYANCILPAIEKAQHEVILVTCFWANSPTRAALCETLLKLSARGLHVDRKIRVRICLSSLSFFQKLFHTTSREGHVYPSSQWVAKLGLPRPDLLRGLDLEVKSIFFLPFSVMHPKFVVVDRCVAVLPSCNVSWERWLEGGVEMSGPVTQQFVRFWKSFWTSEMDREFVIEETHSDYEEQEDRTVQEPKVLVSQSNQHIEATAIFLPSPHHRNPKFVFPWQSCPEPPKTPLNTFLLSAFAEARQSILMQTPNLTAPPVLLALLDALSRGVDVEIITSRRLMVFEQLVTAGTTTNRRVRNLVKEYRAMHEKVSSLTNADLEHGRNATLGELSVSFYEPRPGHEQYDSEPVQSHFKATIIDNEYVVLGSGNMDRASWFTSQELGVAFISTRLAKDLSANMRDVLQTRSRCLYNSRNPDRP